MAVKKKQNEKRYSLMIVPKEVIAKELGKIRKKNKISLETVAEHLKLTIDEVKILEQGALKTKYINAYLYNYMKFLDASFENLYKNQDYKVRIPDIKTGKDLGTETYWMAIDAYTTRFSCREELIRNIRNRHLANIPDVTADDDLWIFIDYPRERNRKIIDLVYSDNEELVKFIDENKIAPFFPFENPYVSKFNEEIKQVFRSSPDSKGFCTAEYRIFARQQYYYYNEALALKMPNWDKKYSDDVVIGGVNYYSNIRANTLCHMAFKKEERRIEKRLRPFNEVDDEKDEPVRQQKNQNITIIPSFGVITPVKIVKNTHGQMVFPLFEENEDVLTDGKVHH